MPFFFEAAILSRLRSPVTSLSELSEREQYVQGEASHGGGGIKLLGHGDERHSMRIEDFDDFGEIRQAAGETIHLIDDDDADFFVSHVLKQLMKRGAIHASAGIAPVSVLGGKHTPALLTLACDESLAGLPLCLQAVE
jgi:hypothetical protein